MSDYTPTTEEVCAAASRAIGSDWFDRWLAAHDAEVRASVLAEQGEPEWEYGYASLYDHNANRHTLRRRKAGPWLPVEENDPESAQA